MDRVVLFGFIVTVVSANIILDHRKYHGLTIALNDELPSDQCDYFITKIEELFQEATLLLDTATSLNFQELKIIVPESWTTCGTRNIKNADGHLYWNTTDIRIGNPHPVFGNHPWTDQFRGCGQSGNFIYIPTGFLTSGFSGKGSKFVQEWAKFRWGVFEEYGHERDRVFPNVLKSTEYGKIPNFCANRQLSGEFSCNSDQCSFNADPDPLITSSLMSIPELDSVTFFCDEENHKPLLPTKQNLLCEGRSSWEIMKKHSDFYGPSSPTDSFKNTLDIEILHENTGLNIVIAFENTEFTNDATNRLTFIKESLSQFIKYEVPDSYKIGLVQFADIPLKVTHLTTLSTNGRSQLVEEIMKTKPGNSKSRNLERAISSAAQLLTTGTGTIVLVSSCSTIGPTMTSQDFIKASSGNKIWIIAYPADNCQYFNPFKDLQNTDVLYIKDKILPAQFPYISPTIRLELSNALRSFLNVQTNYYLQQVQLEECSATEIVCERSFVVPSDFHGEQYLFFYHDYKEHALGTSKITVYGEGACVFVPLNPVVSGTKIYKCNLEEGATVDIHVERDRPSDPMIMELVGLPHVQNSDVKIRLYASDSLIDLKYSEKTAPSLYVEVSKNSRIIHANVSVVIHSMSLESPPDVYLHLNDDGVGADITGNDGIYSSFILPVLPESRISITVFANENSGKAREWPTAASEDTEGLQCCGSSLKISSVDTIGEFSVNVSRIPGRISYKPNSVNLIPGTVRDLAVHQLPNGHIELRFTAIGDDLDYRIVDMYVVSTYMDKYNRKNPTQQVLESSSLPGQIEKFDLGICQNNRYYTVAGTDKQRQTGVESNVASLLTECEAHIQKGSVGSTVGIVFGVIFLIIFIIAIVIAIKKLRQRKHDSSHEAPHIPSKILTNAKHVLPPHPGRFQTTGSKPIHSVHDLSEEIYEDIPQTSAIIIDHAVNTEQKKTYETQKLMCKTTQVPLHSSGRSNSSEGYISDITSINEVGVPTQEVTYQRDFSRSNSDSSGTVV